MRTPRRFGRLLPVVALVSVLAMVGWAPAAQARTVVHDSFSFPVDEVIDDLCPFPIQLSGQVSAKVQAFLDDAGNFTKVILHFSNTFTLSANGSSLSGSAHYNEFDVKFDSSRGRAFSGDGDGPFRPPAPTERRNRQRGGGADRDGRRD
jgi:hypothetical protein